MKIYLIRHGKTAGNMQGRYVGRIDEEVCEVGLCELEKIQAVKADMLFCSPKKRCLQTAAILVDSKTSVQVVDNLAEFDFGDFEGKTSSELAENADYIAWVESGCTSEIPNGESMASFTRRSVEAFAFCTQKAAKENAETIAIVCHGGTVMAVMSHLFSGDFYSYTPKNGGGYELKSESGKLECVGKF